ncbi:MAG: lycopene cyclase domain-containing protein [Microbacteriaceae bacterium]|nr:lycopene cyclase domain-containing protein [Microbacteriaceae bacterium]
MTYLLMNLAFMLIAFVILNVFVRKTPWRMVLWTLIAMLGLTLIFDNVIIALDIVAYDPAKESGLYLGLAPIEDFAYTVVAVLAVSAIWHKMTGTKK